MRRLRIVIAKPGLDGHDRGAKVIARALRDAGAEVIYTGLHRSPQEIVAAAVQEDVDMIGMSILSGAHLNLVQEVREELEAQGLDDVVMLVGGIIPNADRERLAEMGVAGVFGPGTSTADIVRFIQSLFPDVQLVAGAH